jgi:hypothetical protein
MFIKVDLGRWMTMTILMLIWIVRYTKIYNNNNQANHQKIKTMSSSTLLRHTSRLAVLSRPSLRISPRTFTFSTSTLRPLKESDHGTEYPPSPPPWGTRKMMMKKMSLLTRDMLYD